MTDDELQAITFDHERRVDDFIKARIALEESARLIVAASALYALEVQPPVDAWTGA